MRERKDRGKRIDNGKWVEGYLFKSWEKVYILWGTTNNIPNMDRVHPETVGQFTGLKDKNGKDVFENDIDSKGFIIEYLINMSGFYLMKGSQGFHLSHSMAVLDGKLKNIEIIGNTTDNPELLKEMLK